MKLSEEHLKVWDEDTPTKDVWLEVQRAYNVKLTDNRDVVLKKFNLAQFLNGNVISSLMFKNVICFRYF